MSQGVLRRGSATTARDFSKRAGGAAQAICYDRIEKLQRTREDTRGAATLLRSAVRASFKDLAITDEPAATYLADLLTRFARTENLFPPGVALPRLETVIAMLLDVQSAWEENFQPEHEVSVRRHIGDYTMFMTGVFRERVERLASHAFYVAQGKRAYHFVSEHARATQRAAPYRRLAEHFESFASALDYTRRVHFPDGAGHRFFGLAFE